MYTTIKIYFLLFLTYSIIGWILEVVGKLIEQRRFINRGFLIGPYCPIYGLGSLLITILLQRYTGDPIALFILAIVTCSILEYSTSYIMEKIFHARWWDYSQRKFNINGRICLETMLPFGLLGLIMLYGINPIFQNLFTTMSLKYLNIIFYVSLFIFSLDFIISSIILFSVRKENRVLDNDNTEAMSKKVKKVLMSYGWAYKRLLQAFPDVKHIGSVMKKSIDRNIAKIKDKQQIVKQKTEEQMLNIKSKYVKKMEKLKNKTSKKKSN